MNEILKNKFKISSPVLRQLIIYGTVALIPTSVDFLLLYVLTELIGVYYLCSVALAFSVGVFTSYLSQKKLTFKNESQQYFSQFSFFCGVSLVGLILNILIVFSVVEFLNAWYLLGKILATLLVLVWNFSVHKYFTFKKFQ